jgi:glyoxylase-like metal-dependent hydrolase (beta-lactamase superfamily II)
MHAKKTATTKGLTLKIFDNIYLLRVDDGGHTVFPVLFRNAGSGRLALVDSGWPGQFPLIEEAVRHEDFCLEDIETIILTHQDCDHLACVPEFRDRLPTLKVACFDKEEPYIDGRIRPCKVTALEAVFDRMSPKEKNDFYGYRKRYLDSRIPVDYVFAEGEILPYAEGVKIIHSPGHTPGHVCLLAAGTLVAGDALNAHDGKLLGPKPDKCDNYEEAMSSVEKLLGFEFDRIICYHGGLVTGDVKGFIKNILDTARN